MNKAFTLLELLVVIGIIGMLTVLSVANFMSARDRAKDSQRKSDVKQIQNALELYKMDQNPPSYINAVAFNGESGDYFSFPDTGFPWTDDTGNTIYMNKVPGDINKPYYYLPDNATLTYTLAACLANKADKDGQNCDPNEDGWNYPCSSDTCFILHEP